MGAGCPCNPRTGPALMLPARGTARSRIALGGGVSARRELPETSRSLLAKASDAEM